MLQGTAREVTAEFLGTFVLIVFGAGVVAQVVLSGGTAGGYLSINLGWGLAVTMGVYAAGGVSGAHINPAVTVALAVHRRFPWKKVLPYCAGQLAGASCIKSSHQKSRPSCISTSLPTRRSTIHTWKALEISA